MRRVVAYRLLHDEELAAVGFVGEPHRPHALEMPLRILLTNTAHSILSSENVFSEWKFSFKIYPIRYNLLHNTTLLTEIIDINKKQKKVTFAS